MPPPVISLGRKFAAFDERWSPRVVAEMNDYQFKLAKLEGEFIWHAHPDTDETFLVVQGTLQIAFRDGTVTVGPGELCVVPAGVEHKPIAAAECQVLLIEPRGVVNTGDAGGERTAPNDVWV
ncbi:MAG: cupin domain-containing protein [Gemmatimonadetes bacterium]|nr:cupin domain-containing protein [Gemmatimonadota bacterium]HPF61031.1 cupin domain-containing protein [Gemmatimonadales bacterium]HRX19403.1 cupin domain-containing protein [Gemmatimonadales bacterium]